MGAHSPPCVCKRKGLQSLFMCRINWSSVFRLRDLLSRFVVFVVVLAVAARVGFAQRARAFGVASRVGVAGESFLELFAERHDECGEVFFRRVSTMTALPRKASADRCLRRVRLTTRFMSWRGPRRGGGWRSPLIRVGSLGGRGRDGQAIFGSSFFPAKSCRRESTALSVCGVSVSQSKAPKHLFQLPDFGRRPTFSTLRCMSMSP